MEINNIAFLLETDSDDDNDDNELWRNIQDYNDYEVSSFGHIRKTNTQKILKPSKQNGYYSIMLFKNGLCKKHYMHRLVCHAFHQNPNNYSMTDHIDNNKSNNNYINLRWASSSINQRNRTININNTSGVLGVSFNYKNNSWVSQWYDNTGDHKSKSFSIKKYGDDTKQITIDYRRLMEVLNNYTI